MISVKLRARHKDLAQIVREGRNNTVTKFKSKHNIIQ